MAKTDKSDDAWRDQLTPEEFHVLREKGTERAFSGEYNDFKKPGTFVCRACGNDLFDTQTKYESGSGWPSFYAPISPDSVTEVRDVSHGMIRTVVTCNRCGSHLGHVFDDGPQPTGLRYCMNSVALDLKPQADADEGTGS